MLTVCYYTDSIVAILEKLNSAIEKEENLPGKTRHKPYLDGSDACSKGHTKLLIF